MSSQEKIRLIFLCTGNLCRSPMAEGFLRGRLLNAGFGDRATIDSAGMHAEIGRPPEPLAIEVAAEYGVDIAGLISRPFEATDFDSFDYFIAMDLGHLDYLRATCPENSKLDIRMLLDDVGDLKNVEVPDPYRRDRDAYEFSARLIDIGVEHLVKRVFPGWQPDE